MLGKILDSLLLAPLVLMIAAALGWAQVVGTASSSADETQAALGQPGSVAATSVIAVEARIGMVM